MHTTKNMHRSAKPLVELGIHEKNLAGQLTGLKRICLEVAVLLALIIGLWSLSCFFAGAFRCGGFAELIKEWLAAVRNGV